MSRYVAAKNERMAAKARLLNGKMGLMTREYTHEPTRRYDG